MNYTEIIENPNYEELAVFEHNKAKEFLTKELTRTSFWGRIAGYLQLVGSLVLIMGIYKAFFIFAAEFQTSFLFSLLWGLLFSCTLLIVIHELIHAAVYYYLGARKISFGAKFSKFLFYVQADESVFNYKELKILALAPAVVIAALSILGMILFYNQPPFFFFLAIFGIHSFFCSGDLALLCFFENRSEEEILTFDLKKEKKSYFYKKIKGTSKNYFF